MSSTAFGQMTGEQLEVTVDGEQVHQFDWDKEMERAARADRRADTERILVKAGLHTVGVTFLATNYAPGNDLNAKFLRTTIQTGAIPGMTFYPHVGRVRIEGPYDAKGAKDTPSRRKIFVCRPTSAKDEEACARQIVTTLAKRAFRRPPTPQDVGTLMEFYLAGRNDGNFDSGIERALRRLLADPEFVYRRETEPANLAPGKSYRISDLALASRLSFFLWSSIPDDELMNLATQGKLKDPAVLEQQVRRMIADPRSEALVEQLHRAVAERARHADRWPVGQPLSGLRRQPAAGVPARDRAVLRQHRARGPQHPRSADGRLHVRQRTAGQALRDPECVRQRSSAA